MTKRKLLIGLVTAGLFSAGFGAAVFPASAQLRTLKVTLVDGSTVTVQVDVPAGTPLDQIKLPQIALPILSITEIDPPLALPTIPVQPAPAQPEAQPEAEQPTAEAQADQKTTGRAKRKPRREVETAPVSNGRTLSREKRRSSLRNEDGTPTIANPTFSWALPGPAPIGVPNFFIDKFRIPPFLLPIYQAAGIEYGIRWEVLAAINEIETDYGRNLNVSSAGAVGWMQFLPSTWKAYGVDANHDKRKDPYNPVDAIFAAARYLRAAGAEQDLRKAIFAYNHADWYVDSVLMRARLIGGLPTDLVGSLTGLTQGHFPVHAEARYADDLRERDTNRRIAKGDNAAMPVEANTSRRGINIYAKPGSPVVAVQDGKIVRIGSSERLGRFIQLRDAYGNTYTYAHLKRLARGYPVAKKVEVSQEQIERELALPARDPAPSAPASAGEQRTAKARASSTTQAVARPAKRVASVTRQTVVVEKERLFANPQRPAPLLNGGEEQILNGDLLAGVTTFKSYFTQVFGLERDEVEIRRMRVGAKVIAGTILGRIGRTSERTAPHLLFEVRPAGRGAPRIDPKPILDGWKLLESTAIYRAAGKNPFFGPDARTPTIGQILLMSKEALQRRVLTNPRIEVYECGRRDISAGIVDRRVLATLEFLAASGLKPTATSLRCGHSYYTKGGSVSHHSSGNAVDIAMINGIPVLGHQGPGSITEMAVRRLLTLQGTMKPAQIISLMTFDGTDNTYAMGDHADHIHVGFRPLYGTNSKLGRQLNAVLKPGQWLKLIDRIGRIDNPTVLTKPSKYAIKVKASRKARASHAHRGE